MKKIYTFILSAFISGICYSQNCTTPQLTVPPSSTCGQNSALLTANTTATEVKWYNSATATTPIWIGNTYTTPAITSTTSYWAEAYNYELGAQVTGGKATPLTSSSAVVAATSPWGLAFTANNNFLLESVDVFASAGGTLALELLDANYVKIAEKSVTIPAGGTSSAPIQFTVPVGFSVTGGNSYKLVARSSPSMRRDSGSGNAFPFTLGTLGSITGGTINSSNTNNTVYYFFYNWKVSPILGTCASGKVETVVTISAATPPPTAVATQTVSAGSTLANLSVTGQNLIWYTSTAMTMQLPSTTVVTSGTTYYVTQTVSGCQSSTTAITVTTNLSTSDLTLEKNIKIYPNPVSDFVIIESKERIGKISIFDMTGKLIEVINAEENQAQKINVSKYNTGKYILTLENKSGTYNHHFIKK
ncbi:T9SS type A sorting domain-containing protein [Chryseobacterium formosus]|uniref:T9SS type A sorting domain-containing protein n=1 Tax=Chryseobacterium formosus TaxID=1537363 RepID=A0ABT3XN37_9FLAO|nr:T9SS type A sorting domain-containing protein [Chryseobacterium formosus]MCX8522718.1 T9SS type A sorting domain-containing protein [Chryseobacterium formosus]